MGKIVKSARVLNDHYVIAVPDVDLEAVPAAHAELDDRFVAPETPLAFSTGDLSWGNEPEQPEEPVRRPSIDWDAVRNDANGVIDAAVAGGESLLRDAGERARRLVAAAQEQSESIAAAAREAGHTAGLEAGKAEIETQLAQTVASLQGVVDEARAQRQKIIESAEPELVKLAMTIAERIVHEQISIDPEVVLSNVRQALTRLVGRDVVTLRVNPADLDTIRAHREAIAGSSDVEHLRIVEDARVDRGGVVVETDAGTIDAKVSTQIREARRTLLAEPSVFSPAQAS